MDLYAFVVILLVGISYAEDAPLQVSFEDPEPKHVQVGDQLTFVCNINRGLMFMIQHFVEIVRQPVLGGPEVVLAQGGKLTGGEPDFYAVNVQDSSNTISLNFVIKTVRDLDEGFLVCRARTSGADSQTEESKVEILIQRPLSALFLKFDEFDAISTSITDPIEIDAGPHHVQCIAEGSNPATTNIHLYLHGNEVQGLQTVTTKMEADVIKYRTTLSGEVSLTVGNSMQELECSAVSQLGNDRHNVKLTIKIKVYDPKIICNDSEAYRGKKYPMLTCLVDYDGLKIKGFHYQLGEDETQRIHEGTQNNDFVEVKREQLSENKARVILELYEAKDWHFNTPFYLLVEHEDGHMTRQSVRLREVPGNETDDDLEKGPGDSCSLLSVSLSTLVISVWLAHRLPQ